MEPSLDRAMVQSRASSQVVAVPATVVLVADANPRRVSLLFALSGSVTIVLSQDPNMINTSGMWLRSTFQPFAFSLAEHGDLVRLPWYAISQGAATLLFVAQAESYAE